MRKKILGILLTLIFCIGAMPMTSLAAGMASGNQPVIKKLIYYNNVATVPAFYLEYYDKVECETVIIYLVAENGSKKLAATESAPVKTGEDKWAIKDSLFNTSNGAALPAGKKVGINITAVYEDGTQSTSKTIWFNVPSKGTSYTYPVQNTSTNVNLKLKKVKVKKSAPKLVLTATLKIDKTAAAKKKIVFKFKNKKYSAKTNSKGIAKVTIKKAVLKKLKVGQKVTYSATYGGVTKKYTVKVIK